ncbi:MAG: SDR family NAD(P)-dependent oxidoreductase [Eubacterium sp.]|nr:SDR family NAD(P)-dependent oxidoreductase [Eubacterium sp.]
MRIAIVTGASSGMGKIFVKTIINQMKGLDEVWIIARREKRLTSFGTMYETVAFRPLVMDLQKEEDIERLRQMLKDEKPEIACLVHSAGFGIMGRIDDLPARDQEEMVDVNCKSVVSIANMTLPYMEPDGRMIFMASASAFLPQPGFAVYAASKAFVLSFVRALRAEARDRKLRITAVCPGAVRTEFFDRALVREELPVYKKLVMADPKKVVKKAWRDNGRNVEVSVYGLPIRMTRAAAKLLPHKLLLSFMGGKK